MFSYFITKNQIILESTLINYTYYLYENNIKIKQDVILNEYTKIYIDTNLNSNYYIKVNNNTIEVDYYALYDLDEFNLFNYDNQLGVIIDNKITFNVWAPKRTKIELLIKTDNEIKIFNMTKEKSIFTYTLDIKYLNSYYKYRVYNVDGYTDIIDPYSICTIDDYSYIIDLKDTIEVDFKKENEKKTLIYELHIKDFTNNTNSKYKNKFLGLIDTKLKNNNQNIGIDHLIELGVTHIQLLPIFSFENTSEYNWGYMPTSFNSLNEIYSVNKINMINEFKNVIQFLHSKNIGVIMDVVYNHTATNSFEVLVPGYFYRKRNNKFSNGSGCGNEVASERYMCRKFIVDSISYWAKEFKLSGFRFDLMGLIDIDTMNLISKTLKNINKDIILYGEPWFAEIPSLDLELCCIKKNICKLNNIMAFDDEFRDAIKGNVFDNYSIGFVQGNTSVEIINKIKKGIYNINKINYVSCHDNHTLFDKLSFMNINLEEKLNMQKQANAIIILSSGTSFIHSGDELCRSKEMNHNTYNSSININEIKWLNKSIYYNCFLYYKNLIEFSNKIDFSDLQFNNKYNDLIYFTTNSHTIIHNSYKENYIKFEDIMNLVFLDKEINKQVKELLLEKNKTYIFKNKKVA